MKKLWVRWVALVLLVIVLGLVMIRLGQWQLHRLSGRREANNIIRTNHSKPPVEWSTLMGDHEVTSQQQWRPVIITGTFDTAHELQVRYRSNGDDDGSEVVTPVVTKGGRHVLIDRGFLKRSSHEGDTQALPPAPSGTVMVTGLVKGNEHGNPPPPTPWEARFVSLTPTPSVRRRGSHTSADTSQQRRWHQHNVIWFPTSFRNSTMAPICPMPSSGSVSRLSRSLGCSSSFEAMSRTDANAKPKRLVQLSGLSVAIGRIDTLTCHQTMARGRRGITRDADAVFSPTVADLPHLSTARSRKPISS